MDNSPTIIGEKGECTSIDADSFINGGKNMKKAYSAYPFFINEKRRKGIRVIWKRRNLEVGEERI